MRADRGGAMEAAALSAAKSSLRWVTDAAVAAGDGASWPVTRAPGSPLADDLYHGTAGVLMALAEARLSGISDFDEHAVAAARRLAGIGRAWTGPGPGPGPGSAAPAAGPGGPPPLPDVGLYTGLGGAATALRAWALASGDSAAREASLAISVKISRLSLDMPPAGRCPDIISGDAGVLLALLGTGDAGVRPAVSALADRIVAGATWIGDKPDWRAHGDGRLSLPNFSHGAAGIGYALAVAASALGRPDLLQVAASAARRLAELGTRPDGTLAVPHSIPLIDPGAPVSYGWCHGPTGTMRLFQILDRMEPGRGWGESVGACRRAIRLSGLPERRYPGFWDNLGQCCGTAGVGEMALDSYQETGDAGWLGWAGLLARDVLRRRIEDEAGVRWSHTEHRLRPPELEPATGWMQGAAGIAGWLLRLSRVEGDGAGAPRAWWPDRPPLEGIQR